MQHFYAIFMFEKTQAIVIHCQKHSDKAVILHAYTRSNGRQNLMVYGGKKKGNIRGLIGTALALVEIEYENKPGHEMHTLHSINPLYLPQPQNSEQQLVGMLISEVIYKTLKQPMADERVYDFLEESVKRLNRPDELKGDLAFVKEFMETLSALLGYGGVWLDEWKELNSLKMIQEMLG